MNRAFDYGSKGYRFESYWDHKVSEEKSSETFFNSRHDVLPVQDNVKLAQRKIPVDLHFIVRLRHKASGAALGPSCAVCFEQPAGVFAGCGAVCQAKILASLKIKNGISG